MSAPDTVGFVKEDNNRDTISLVLSCFATLGICVYSAVHLNVPPRHEPYRWTLLRELKWCLIGLFAPELVLYTAWRQRASAAQLYDEIQSCIEVGSRVPHGSDMTGETIGTTKTPWSAFKEQRPAWTVRHGFYATMGGIAIDLDTGNSHHTKIFGTATRLTLTAKGVSLLARCGHLPHVSAEDIKDKNKTDSLAKVIVCIQAGWMIVQVISRRAYNLPITLLEVNTVAHVACALLMYTIWWHKPRQVESPTLLQGDWVFPFAVYMYSASRMSGKRPQGTWSKYLNPVPELRQFVYIEGADDVVENGHGSMHKSQRPSTSKPPLKGRLQLLQTNTASETPSATTEDEWQAERIRLIEQAIQTHPPLRAKFTQKQAWSPDPSHSSTFTPYATELVQASALNWPNAGLLRRTQSLILGMILWGASMAYGAIHVSAWNYFFPTRTEHVLWRLSSVWVTFCAALWLAINLLAHFMPFVNRVWMAFNAGKLGVVANAAIILACTLCGVSFVASRAFLVVEAFVSIRRVPAGVYVTPAWSQVFPHL